MKYIRGQQLWRATFDAEETSVVCPECGGTRHIRVVLYDGTELAINCQGCARGFVPPTGFVPVYDRAPRAEAIIVTGFEVDGDKTEYRTDTTYRVLEDDLYERQEDALAAAHALAARFDREERERVAKKEKPTRSWSWHVHYHRQQIREAEKSIAYHQAAARVRAKEPQDG
jgi:ribosomal protein S27E